MSPSSGPLFENFSDLLTQRAAAHGEREAYRFLPDGEGGGITLSYAELDHRARAIAGWLQDRVEPESRVLLVLPQGLEFLTAFFGCLHAGVIAVPAYPPRRNRRASRLLSMVADAQVSTVLSSCDVLSQMELVIQDEPALASLSWQAVEEIEPSWAKRWKTKKIVSDTVAFLQYTSGSTGTPKGVIVSHGNLLHNQELIRGCFGQTEAIVCVGWLPLHHDMGLIGNALHPIYLGGRLIFMSPIDFIQKPIRWLKAISNYQATITGAPNFAYRLCAEEIDLAACQGLDLSRWEVAFNGAEPVRVETMRRFSEKFAPLGFRPQTCTPCYGMAETTLLVTGAVKDEPLITGQFETASLERGKAVPSGVAAADSSANAKHKFVELAACGRPSALDVRIVDPETRQLCELGTVGEIWVAGGSVTQGYWQREAETEQTFAAVLALGSEPPATADQQMANASQATKYLRTGDLGFLHNEQLYVTGRLKELIIARGVNHYPTDIERTVETSHPALVAGGAAAFSLEDGSEAADAASGDNVAGEERVVVVQEVQRAEMRSLDVAAVTTAIRMAVSEEHELGLHAVVLVRPGNLPRTTSGKTQRRQARTLFREDGFKVVGAWENAAKRGDALATKNSEEGTPATTSANPFSAEPATGLLSADQQNTIEELQKWLTEKVSERLGVAAAQFDPHQPLASYGMTSVAAVRLSGELSDHLGRKIAPTLAYEFPTLAKLARHLVVGEEGTTGDLRRGRLTNPCDASVTQQERCDNEDKATTQPVAVIGMGCRFPGARDLRAFWELLHGGKSGISAAPKDRWPTPQTGLPTRGGFLDDVRGFDASLFGISPREADFIDPQQRLLLEVSWEACEDAHVPLSSLAGSRVGVFIGASNNDYLRLQAAARVPADGYAATGSSAALAANRLSYTFDLLGPSFTIDTACSASLVAVERACRSLQRGECEQALAGGVNLILAADATQSLHNAGMLSADGVCRAFAAGANGFVRGEGCGVVLLKPLKQAIADGNKIYACIRGGALNQDGRSNGLTAPNPQAQKALLRAALADANVQPEAVGYLEAHGTGTELGDPIELGAIRSVLAVDEASPRDAVLRVGSVKTNIGHLEAAAGVAGLIKCCLSLSAEEIPPNLNFDEPNPHIDWPAKLEIPTAVQRWEKRANARRIAGVSSFGFGGANAHLILEEAPVRKGIEEDKSGDKSQDTASPYLLTLSGRSEAALRAAAAELAACEAAWQQPLEACVALAAGRSHLKQRVAVPISFAIEESKAEAANRTADVRANLVEFSKTGKLASGALGSSGRGATGVAAATTKVFWLFTGQGGTHQGVGQELYRVSPVFRDELNKAAAALEKVWPASLTSLLWEDAAAWQRVDVQPALFCLQVAIAQTWLRFGVQPAGVAGHSFGEYAAACTAGLISLEVGLQLVAERAKLVDTLPDSGGMLAVFADEAQVREELSELSEPARKRVDIAAINGPKQTVVAGDEIGLAATEKLLKSKRFTVRRLQTSHGFHSPLVDPILQPFEVAAANLVSPETATTGFAFYSGQSGDVAGADAIQQPAYWRNNLRQPVRFYPLLETFVAAGGTHCLEIGAGSTLSSLVRSSRLSLQALPGLKPGPTETASLLENVAKLHVAGCELDWASVFGKSRYELNRLAANGPDLPTYPFQRQLHWFDREVGGPAGEALSTKGERQQADSSTSDTQTTSRGKQTEHPLLGTRLDIGGAQIVFETKLVADSYLAEHRVRGAIVFPAAAYLELATAAARELGVEKMAVVDVEIGKRLVIPEAGDVTLQIILSPRAFDTDEPASWSVLFTSKAAEPDSGWQQHATCRLVCVAGESIESSPAKAKPFEEPPATSRVVSLVQHYARSEAIGIAYGAAFRGLVELRVATDLAWGRVALPAELAGQAYGLHPALLDACLQVTAGAIGERYRRAWLPVGFARYELLRTVEATEELQVVARLVTTDSKGGESPAKTSAAKLTVDLQLWDAEQELVGLIEAMTLVATKEVDVAGSLWRETWVPQIRRVEANLSIDSQALATEFEQFKTVLLSRQQEIVAGTDVPRATAMLDALERFSGTCSIHVLKELGLPLSQGDVLTAMSVSDEFGVSVDQARLLRRLFCILQEEGVLQLASQNDAAERWVVAHSPAEFDWAVAKEELLAKYPEATSEVTLISRCMESLPAVLRGEVEPLPLLFPTEGGVTAADVYRESVGGKLLNQLAAAAIAPAVEKLRRGQGLRILEIGAGTGGTTSAILPELPAERVRYAFTDISGGFFSPAKARFGDYAFVDYRVLDIERDPEAQGFDRASFDVVLAANVLHATADLSVALENVRNLLAPGGRFVAIEGTRPVRWLDLTFGLTPGWWRFTDTERRRDYPLLSEQGWQELLVEKGFTPPICVDPLRNEADASATAGVQRASENSVIVAELREANVPARPERRWLLVAEEQTSPLGKQLPGTVQRIAWSTEPTDTVFDQQQPTDLLCVVPSIEDSAELVPELVERFQHQLLKTLQAAERFESRRALAARSELQRALAEPVAPDEESGAESAEHQEPLRIWLVTTGATKSLAIAADEIAPRTTKGLIGAALWGMLRTVALEQPLWDCIRFDLPALANAAEQRQLILDEVLAIPRDEETEIAISGDQRCVRRIESARDLSVDKSKTASVLKIAERGSLAGLKLQQQARREPKPGEVELEVVASGMNFRDVLNALGIYPTQPPLGAECTGVVSRLGAGVSGFQVGDRVAALAGDSLCDVITLPAESVVRLPAELAMNEAQLHAAATIPVAFLTASVALLEQGELGPKDTVLIHSAAGGVGMAAIQIAQAVGATVLATASVQKHELIRSLGIEHVFSSREPGFAERVKQATEGRGVSVLLNSLDDSFVEENLVAIAADGRYVDIAKSNEATVAKIQDARENVRYAQLDLSKRIAEQPAELSRQLAEIYAAVVAGRYQPLPFETFPLDDATAAFRRMRSGKQTGKLLLASKHDFSVSRKASGSGFGPDATYLITGGLGGLGLLTAKWILEHGGKRFVLLARRSPTEKQLAAVAELTERGAEVRCVQVDVADRQAVENVCEEIRRGGYPLRGVFHLAGALSDGLLGQQSPEKFAAVAAGKIRGGWNLHLATETDKLDHFVLYSSAAGFLGSPGQANHSSANAFLDALAHFRRQKGEPGTSINWGPWAEVGAAAELGVEGRADLGGIESLTVEEGLGVLDVAMKNDVPQIGGVRLLVDQLPTRLSSWPLFSRIWAEIDASVGPGNQHLGEEIRSCPPEERVPRMADLLQSLLQRTLGMDKNSSIPEDEAFFDLGLDSLTALELAGSLQSILKVKVLPVEFFNYPNLLTLANRLVQLSFDEDPSARSVGTESSPLPDSVPAINPKLTAETPSNPAENQKERGAAMQPDGEDVSDLLDEIQEISDEFDRWEAS